jgi:HK97 family phage prohead protease
MTSDKAMRSRFCELKSATVTGQEFIGVVSTATVDRDDEVLLPEGARLHHYARNPILLWQHDPEKPIGTGDRGDIKATADGIRVAYRLARRPDWYTGEFFPDYVRALIADGVLKGLSVGFRVLEGGIRNPSTKDIERFGQEVKRVINKWELLEVSVVSVPCNPDARIAAVTKRCDTAQPSRKHVIEVRVPRLGAEDVQRIAREELAKSRGVLFARL